VATTSILGGLKYAETVSTMIAKVETKPVRHLLVALSFATTQRSVWMPTGALTHFPAAPIITLTTEAVATPSPIFFTSMARHKPQRHLRAVRATFFAGTWPQDLTLRLQTIETD